MEPATTLPNNIAVFLHAVRTLLTYGRHLIDTVSHRATAPNFNAIAASFGTANLSTILAHLNRGLLRAAALERVLLARAATGRDIDFVERRTATLQLKASTHGDATLTGPHGAISGLANVTCQSGEFNAMLYGMSDGSLYRCRGTFNGQEFTGHCEIGSATGEISGRFHPQP